MQSNWVSADVQALSNELQTAQGEGEVHFARSLIYRETRRTSGDKDVPVISVVLSSRTRCRYTAHMELF